MAAADRISGQLAAAFAPGPGAVIADMTATTFCDSSGVRVLVLAHHLAATHGTELRLLLQPGDPVLRTMKVLGVDGVLPIYHRLDEALTGRGATEAEILGHALSWDPATEAGFAGEIRLADCTARPPRQGDTAGPRAGFNDDRPSVSGACE
jgi:anti-sigma B factor antagonist